jgi:outer membrane protein assembly factor BamB
MLNYRSVLLLAFVLGTSSLLGPAWALGDHWPQWRGPDRNGLSKETGLLGQWPGVGPPQEWSITNLGAGYGSVAIQGNRIYAQMVVGRQSAVASVDRSNGRLVWSQALGRSASNGEGHGPRGTPTVDGDRLYVLTENGDLACLATGDGSILWQRNILSDFGGRNISWLISESPLVDGSKVIVTPGGRGAGVVALDKMSGETIWKSAELSDTAGYASLVATDIEGVRTLATLTAAAGVGLRASDGKLMWSYRRAANRTANIATPVFHDNKVFYTSGYGTGGGLLALSASGGEVQAEEVYFTRQMANHHGGVIVVDGYLYGFHNSILTCLDFATGDVMWRHRSVGKGSLTYADGNLYIFSERNVVGLAEATPTAYREKGRFQVADQGWPSYAHPVVSDGRLYIRNQGTLTSYDIRAR